MLVTSVPHSSHATDTFFSSSGAANVASSRTATVFNSILPALMTDRYLPDNRLPPPTGCVWRQVESRKRSNPPRKTISTDAAGCGASIRRRRPHISPFHPLSRFFSLSLFIALSLESAIAGKKSRGIKRLCGCVSAQKWVPDSGIKTPRGLANFQLFPPRAFRLFETREYLARHRLLNNGTDERYNTQSCRACTRAIPECHADFHLKSAVDTASFARSARSRVSQANVYVKNTHDAQRNDIINEELGTEKTHKTPAHAKQ